MLKLFLFMQMVLSNFLFSTILFYLLLLKWFPSIVTALKGFLRIISSCFVGFMILRNLTFSEHFNFFWRLSEISSFEDFKKHVRSFPILMLHHFKVWGWVLIKWGKMMQNKKILIRNIFSIKEFVCNYYYFIKSFKFI